jgi:hypothetical protein
LNGTSDLAVESLFAGILAEFPNVVFYDYTKSARRMNAYLDGAFPANYSLTFSRSETNGTETAAIMARGGNVAVPFTTKRGEAFPATWNGVRIIDGDVSDLRFTDPHGVVVGLRAKGKARKAVPGGFVVLAEAC